MKTDLYTKIVLTVIAVALTIGLIKDLNLVTPAHASIPAPVVNEAANAHQQGVIDVNIVKVNGSSFYSSSGIPVEVKNYKDFK